MLHEISFKSFNERDEVQGWVYVPACEPKGIIQLIHGFGEHSRRYFHMIVAFMDAGFIVAADDHVGHGKTAIVNNTWGDWGHKGAHTMMEDEHILTGIVKETYPNLPYFMFGHSMGSFIARDYIAKYGDELAADPFDAFTKPTNNRSMLFFCEMMDCIQGTEWAGKVPKELPIYNIAGDLDPVGNWGEGVYQTTNWLAETGHNVKTKLYSGYRHEIHNYDEIKAEVEAGIVGFFKDCLK